MSEKTATIKRLVRDGKVAVLYNPIYGAGWSTIEHDRQLSSTMMFDPIVVHYVEENMLENLCTYVALKYPKVNSSYVSELAIRWIPVGTRFRINEYDGSEWIEYMDEIDWETA